MYNIDQITSLRIGVIMLKQERDLLPIDSGRRYAVEWAIKNDGELADYLEKRNANTLGC